MATEAAKLLARVGADLSGLQTGMQQANQIVVSGAKTLQSSASSAGAQMGSAMASSMVRMLGGSLGGITSMLMPLGAGALAAGGTIALAKTFIDLSISIDDVSQSSERAYRTFQRLAGSDAPAALEKMREATRGAVTDADLMSATTRFLSMHLADNADEAARLAEIATQLGMAMSHPGGPTGAMSDFALMLANQSILRLDQFGLSSGRVRDRIEELTAANVNMNHETAFMTAVLEEADRAIERVGEQAPTTSEKLDAMWTNLQTNARAAAGALNELNGAGGDGGRTSLLERMQTSLFNTGGERQSLIQRIREGLAEKGAELSDTAAQLAQSSMRYLQFQEDVMAKQAAGALSIAQANEMIAQSMTWEPDIKRGAVSTAELEARIEALVTTVSGGVATGEQWELTLKGMASAAAATAAETDGLTKAQRALLDEMGTSGWQAAKKAYQMAQLDPSGQLAYLRRQRDEVAVGSEKYIKLSTEIIRLEKQIQAEQDATARSAIADAQAVAEARQAQMKALVESAFRPSAVTGRDWLETSLGVYANKPDEYLRRLRSAVEDANSLWKDLLGGRTGDEAKLYLAQQEEAWSAGQWESLGPGFDQEASRQAIIDSVIRQVESDRTRQAMIASIMSDPRLLALGLSAAEVAQVTGGPLAGAGVEQAEMLLSGAQAVDVGGELTATIVAQFQAEEKSFVTMGGMMMSWISTGLKGAEPTAWQQVVEALFPGIYDKLQQTGAVKTP